MRVINWLVIIILFVFWLAEDEVLHIEESVQEGEFEMSFVQEVLDSESGACIEIGQCGSVIIGTPEQGSVTLSANEAYSLLDVLYRYVDVLRGRQDTVPLQVPQAEQWRATATCQIDEKHTGRDVFRCDGCKRLACNECGETVEDVWLCERCLVGEKEE